MKCERLYAAVGAADDDLILRAECAKKANINSWLKYCGLAACLCLVTAGAILVFKHDTTSTTGKPVLQWSNQFSAADYFKYSSVDGNGMSSSASDVTPPYAETRSYSDEREQLESEDVIPVISTHPLFHCEAHFNDDGSLYSVVISWHIRGSMDTYSDLVITAGHQEIKHISDCISIAIDDYGNIITPAVTVTERDGVQIVAEGFETGSKTITFQNDSGWYQITGSFNDDYSSMVLLLDWFWVHPINFERFSIDTGDEFTVIKLDQMPDAFSNHIPGFDVFGFIESSSVLVLKNGIPYSYEGQYIAHVPEEQVKDGNYYDSPGWTIIHWCVFSDPDYYYIQESLGDLSELTEQLVFNQFDSSRNQSRIIFTWDGLLILIYSNTAQELWSVIQSLQ